MSDKPWWWPVLANAAYFARLREDYPEHTDEDDDWLHQHYGEGRKYPVTWDHVGDAYAEYEELVDAFFTQEQQLTKARADLWEALELLHDATESHVNKKAPEYQQYKCDITPCAWCEGYHALLAANPDS